MPTFELQPAQYSKIKLGEWTYSSSERQKVVSLARKAFDELKLPADADERLELDRKEAAAVRSKSSSPTSSSGPSSRSTASIVHPLPAKPESVVQSAASSRNASPAPPASKQKLVNGKKDGEHKSPVSKKEHKEKSVFSKQLNKFRAEKRAASLPNGKGEKGVASPRLASTPIPSASKHPAVPSARKERSTSAEKDKEMEKNRKPSGKRRSSRDYSSSEGESDAEPAPPSKAKKAREVDQPAKSTKKRPSPDYSSSTDEDRPRGRSAKRSSPPPPTTSKTATHTPTKINGFSTASSSSTSSAPPRSAEDMRERYEELFPAYQQLTKKLVGVYQDCEDVEEEGEVGLSKDEVAKMAQRWQKWHNELEGIRQWFDGGNA